MSFNLHKNPKTYYRENLLLFKPFKEFEIYLKYDENSWKVFYMKKRDKIEMIQKQFVFKINNVKKICWWMGI